MVLGELQPADVDQTRSRRNLGVLLGLILVLIWPLAMDALFFGSVEDPAAVIVLKLGAGSCLLGMGVLLLLLPQSRNSRAWGLATLAVALSWGSAVLVTGVLLWGFGPSISGEPGFEPDGPCSPEATRELSSARSLTAPAAEWQPGLFGDTCFVSAEVGSASAAVRGATRWLDGMGYNTYVRRGDDGNSTEVHGYLLGRPDVVVTIEPPPPATQSTLTIALPDAPRR